MSKREPTLPAKEAQRETWGNLQATAPRDNQKGKQPNAVETGCPVQLELDVRCGSLGLKSPFLLKQRNGESGVDASEFMIHFPSFVTCQPQTCSKYISSGSVKVVHHFHMEGK